MKRFDGRVALITGGARGIGQEIAQHLAEEGAAIALVDIAREDGERAAAGLASRGVKASFHFADASKRSDCEEAVAGVLRHHGQIDLLVNNIGVAKAKPFLDTTEADWATAIESNLVTTMRFSHIVIPHMIARSFGRILNMSSVAGRMPRANAAPYAVAKAGVIALTRSLAVAYAENGIRVNALAPATINTEVAKTARATDETFRKFAEDLTRQIVLKRWGEPAEVARAALFLLSEESSYVTGQTLSVDGGSCML